MYLTIFGAAWWYYYISTSSEKGEENKITISHDNSTTLILKDRNYVTLLLFLMIDVNEHRIKTHKNVQSEIVFLVLSTYGLIYLKMSIFLGDFVSR